MMHQTQLYTGWKQAGTGRKLNRNGTETEQKRFLTGRKLDKNRMELGCKWESETWWKGDGEN
jgi:hypothetical protein